MKLLLLIPNLKGYQTTLGDNHALTARASGLPRRRRVRVGAIHRYELNFTVKNGDFDYLMAFWRLTQDQAFACQLVSDTSQIRWERVRWASVPRITNKGGGVFGVSVQAVQDRPEVPPTLSNVGRVVASPLYPYADGETYVVDSNITRLELYDKVITQSHSESIYPKATVSDLMLKDIVFDYRDNYPDGYTVNGADIKELVLYDKVFAHSDNYPDSYTANANVTNLTLFDKVVTHIQPSDNGTAYQVQSANIVNLTLTDI